MNIDWQYNLGDLLETERNVGKVVAVSASEGRHGNPYFKTYRLQHDDGSFSWCPEFRVRRCVGW